ncbi:MAG TPA: hypothetical protein DCM38_04610 [Gammaproteobacteria bacterium]|nr:hypothetical protein [Gammaproteobacteria bacterium]
MLAYRQHITIENPKQVLLSNLPLTIGQQVEVLILVKDAIETPIATPRQPLSPREDVFSKQRLSKTSSLEHLRAIRDEESV